MEKPTVQTFTSTVTRWKGKMPKKRAWENSKRAMTPWREYEIRPYRDCTKETGNKIQPWLGQRTPLCLGVITTKEKRGVNAAIFWDCSMGWPVCSPPSPILSFKKPFEEQDLGIREQPKYPPLTPAHRNVLTVIPTQVSGCCMCGTQEAHRIHGKTEQWFPRTASLQKQNCQKDNADGKSQAEKHRLDEEFSI